MEINLGNTVPLFAHDVAISTLTRSNKGKNGKAKKEIFTELVFIDGMRKTAITRMVLPMSVLEQLPKTIEENLKKIKKEMKDKEMPKQKTEVKSSGSYLG
ncbi:MAG: hypothetical protein WC511_04460 [Candidatus Pacearchaeota archaeon]